MLLYSRALSACEVAAIAGGIDSPPCIVTPPKSQLGYDGTTVTFSVLATGAPPLSYLWYKDTFPISWATNSTLDLVDLQASDAGGYSVVVTNPLGSITSSTAQLTVNPVGVALGTYSGLTIQGAVGKNYGIQYATNLSPTNTWITLTNLSLSQPTEMWFDATNNISAGVEPHRYYRVIVLP